MRLELEMEESGENVATGEVYVLMSSKRGAGGKRRISLEVCSIPQIRGSAEDFSSAILKAGSSPCKIRGVVVRTQNLWSSVFFDGHLIVVLWTKCGVNESQVATRRASKRWQQDEGFQLV